MGWAGVYADWERPWAVLSLSSGSQRPYSHDGMFFTGLLIKLVASKMARGNPPGHLAVSALMAAFFHTGVLTCDQRDP